MSDLPIKCATAILFDQQWKESDVFCVGRVVFECLGKTWQVDYNSPRSHVMFCRLQVFDRNSLSWGTVIDYMKLEFLKEKKCYSAVCSWVDAVMPLAIRIIDGE